jgi:predicted dehydrogenase
MDAEQHGSNSDDIDAHTKTNKLNIHYAARNQADEFTKADEIVVTEDEPDHQGLCELEQEFFLRSVVEDSDLTEHLEDALNSLKIVLACDEAVRTGKTVFL